MPETNLGKLYYTIGEASEMLQVNPSLIRYWEKEFSQLKPKKSRRGNRLFTVKDIEILKYIHFLVKVQGHTLEGAKKLLKTKKSDDLSEFKTLHTLKKVKKMLEDFRGELEEESPKENKE
jgi:DNA-binding transcriptional MerR regulator